MSNPRFLSGLVLLALSLPLCAQAPPTAYTITQAVNGAGNGALMTTYRSGQRAVTDMFYPTQPGAPAHHVFTFYDLTAGVSHTWDPSITPPSCSAGTFSGDWGDPFQMSSELLEGIKKGELKPGAAEAVHGIPAKIYTGASQEQTSKPGLMRRMASFSAPLLALPEAPQPH